MNSGIIEDIENYLEEKYGVLIALSYKKSIKAILINGIRTPPEYRNLGIGTKVLTDLCNFADKFNLLVVLSPTKDLGGCSVQRLQSFYKTERKTHSSLLRGWDVSDH